MKKGNLSNDQKNDQKYKNDLVSIYNTIRSGVFYENFSHTFNKLTNEDLISQLRLAITECSIEIVKQVFENSRWASLPIKQVEVLLIHVSELPVCRDRSEK